jgi:hypothetical protein
MSHEGFRAVLQIREGGITGGGGEWITVGGTRDCTLNTTMGEADATHRAGGGFTMTMASLDSASVEFEVLWLDDDEAQTLLETAYRTRATIGVRVLDKPLDELGEGLLANAQVLQFARREPLSDTVRADCIIKPTYSTVAPSWLEEDVPLYVESEWEPGGDGLTLTFDAPVALGPLAIEDPTAAAPIVFTDDTGASFIVETFDNAVFAGNTVRIPAADVRSVLGDRIYVSAASHFAGGGVDWASTANAVGAPNGTYAEATITSGNGTSDQLRCSTAAAALPAEPIGYMVGFKGKTDDDTSPVDVEIGLGAVTVLTETLTEANTEYEDEATLTAEQLAAVTALVISGFTGASVSTSILAIATGTVAGDTKAQIDAIWIQPIYGEDLANEKITIANDTFRNANFPARTTQAIVGVTAGTLTVIPS